MKANIIIRLSVLYLFISIILVSCGGGGGSGSIGVNGGQINDGSGVQDSNESPTLSAVEVDSSQLCQYLEDKPENTP